MKKIFRYQFWHLAFVLLAVVVLHRMVNTTLPGRLWGVGTNTWFWVAVAAPIAHQIYVWLIWRLELYQRRFTTRYGLSKAFTWYAIGFSILFAGRLVFIIILAVSDQHSLSLNPAISYTLAALITPPVIYLFYSVKKYFTMERAYGIDHFDVNYNEPFVKKGIFRYTANGMYVFGLMILYLPGLLLLSRLALLVAVFNHIYIWVHYYCTERPDMNEIYGTPPSR